MMQNNPLFYDLTRLIEGEDSDTSCEQCGTPTKKRSTAYAERCFAASRNGAVAGEAIQRRGQRAQIPQNPRRSWKMNLESTETGSCGEVFKWLKEYCMVVEATQTR